MFLLHSKTIWFSKLGWYKRETGNKHEDTRGLDKYSNINYMTRHISERTLYYSVCNIIHMTHNKIVYD